MAVRVGFEPTVPFRVRRFSRPIDSTTLAPHREVLLQSTKPQPSLHEVVFHFIEQTALLRFRIRRQDLPELLEQLSLLS